MSKADPLSERIKTLYEICASHHDNIDSGESLPLSQEGLLDGFISLYDECGHDNLARNKNVSVFTKKYEDAVSEATRLMVKASDFVVKDVIGRGHFGVVQVVRDKEADMVYAMKVLRKNDILAQPEISFYQEERDIMASASSDWITQLHYAFQDSTNLYLVMDFHPGGDLLSLLARHEDIFEEEMARFYLSEIAVAINDLHGMGYVHRDIKPENILLDHSGHIKLADFGSAAKMSADMLVSSRMPVGTPDYVAPELLTSMNSNRGPRTYSVEVDWWSLGVCAYEMMHGKTPFTDEYGSMVTTYSNIMNFKSKLKFPEDAKVCESAQDLMRNMLTDQELRFTWPDIRKHKFFSSIDWKNIGQGPPPFVPTLSGLDDTSNFEEVEKVKPQASLEEFKVHKDFSGKDLPFIGFTYIRDLKDLCYCSCHAGKGSSKTLVTDSDGNTSVSLQTENDSTNLEVTLTVKIAELRSLKERCSELEESEVQLKSESDRWRRKYEEKDKLGAQEDEMMRLQHDVDMYVKKTKSLSEQLSAEGEERRQVEKQAEQLYLQIQYLSHEARTIQEEVALSQMEELRDIISQLEMENENLLRRLRQKDAQIHTVTNTLTDAQKQLAHMQLKLDKERRKSRDDQRRDLAMMENRDDAWKQQVEEKQETIDELNRKLRDLEDLVEAYEVQEKEHAEEIDLIRNKMNTSLRENGQLVPLSRAMPTSPKRKVELFVTLQTGRTSILNSSHLEEKIKDLQDLVDHYSCEARSWRQREDDMKSTIQKMKEERSAESVNESKSQKKENLFNHLKLYQQEVHDQKKLIKDLQATMRSCLEERQVKSGELRLTVQSLEEEKKSLEGELEREQEDSAENKALLDKQNKELDELYTLVTQLQADIKDLEHEKKDIEEEYSSKMDNSVQKQTSEKLNLEKKISTLEKDYSTLQREVEDKSDQLKSADRRLTESKSQIQQLHEQKTDLQTRMESLQRKSASHDDDLKIRSDLNDQINTLQHDKRTVEGQMDRLIEEKDELQRKLRNVEKDKEDLKQKLKKLENVEREKSELEIKVNRLERLEKEKREAEEKLDKLRNVSREKNDLEAKVAKLERIGKEKERLEEQLQSVEREKRELERKLTRLERREKEQDALAQRLERENKSLEGKVTQLQKVEGEKHTLQEKVITLQRLEAEVDELKEKVRTGEKEGREKARMIARKGEVEVENASLTEELKEKRNKLQEKIRQFNEVEAERDSLKLKVERLKKYEDEVGELKERLRCAERGREDQSEKLTVLEKSREELETVKTEKKELESKLRKLELTKIELESVQSEKKDLQGKVKKMEMNKLELENMQSEKRDLEAKLKRFEKVKLDLEKVESEKRDLEVKVIRLERLDKEKKDLEEKLKNLEKGKFDVQKSEEERRTLQRKVTQLERVEVEKRDLEEKLKKTEKEKQDLENSEKEKQDLEIRVNCLVNVESEKKELEEKVSQLSKLERENVRLDEKLKVIEKQKDDLEKKVKDLESKMTEKASSDKRRSLVDRLQSEKSDLQRKVENLEKEKDNINRANLTRSKSMHENDLKQAKSDLEDKVRRLEKVTGDLEQELSRSKQQLNKMSDMSSGKQSMQERVDSLMKENTDLKAALDKSNAQAKRSSSVKLEAAQTQKEDDEIQRVRNSLKRTKSFAAPKDKEVGDLEQEKRYLEAKVTRLQKQLDQRGGDGVSSAEVDRLRQENEKLETRVKKLTEGTATLQKELETLLEETEGVEELKDDNEKLKSEVTSLTQQLTAAREQRTARNENNSNSNSGGSSTLADVRQELNESNLALSEARSLLSAAKRQEQELRDQIHLMQRQLDTNAHENGVKRNDSVSKPAVETQVLKRAQEDRDDQLKLLQSKYEMFSRQNKTLEEKLIKLQKERSLDFLEHNKVRAQLNDKDRQIDMEVKKVEKFRGVCKELEEQMRDMEALVAEFEKREAEWNKIRRTYEQVVDEREEELEGTSQKLSAVELARSASNERMSGLKHQLKSAKAAHKAEVEALNHQLWEERNKTQKLSNKMSETKEQNDKSEHVLSQQRDIIDAQDTDKIKLKEEISKILTENQELKLVNLEIRSNLSEAMDKFELIFGEKINLENFTEAMQGLHFLEKYKFESTIGQQMKLIDYLQELWHDSMSKKKKSGKLFGSMKKSDLPCAVPQWKEFQAGLEAERKRNGKLQDQVDRLRQENFQLSNEVLKLKGPLREKLILEGTSTLTPKVKAAVAALAHSPSSQPDPRVRSDSPTFDIGAPTTPQPKQQRMHHKIPHRFVTGLNTRATKCAVCLGSVHFVKQAAKCQECHIVCHPRCVSSVAASCGLPTEYVRHYTDIMDRLNKEPLPFGDDTIDVNTVIQMDGWLKVPRTGKPGWEKRYVTLDGTWLMVYTQQGDANPIETLELNPADAEMSVHSAVTSAELSSIASSDLAYVLRVDHDPHTTCWPGRVMYFMALTFAEKQRWVASLEAAVKSAKKGDTFRKSKIQMSTVVSFSERKEVNCSLVLSKTLTLLGAEEGLFAVNPQSPNTSDKLLIPLTGISNIHQMTLAAGLGVIIMITGSDRRLVMVDKKLIKLRLSQCNGGETAPLPLKHIEGVQGCTVFDVGMWQDSTYLCVGMTDRVVLLKYNTSLAMFCVRKEFDSFEPCSCVCIAENFAIVGTEKFFKINLDHPSMIDFVDRQDSSLAFAAFGAANHHSYPLAVVQVSPAGLPLEFLLCFHEFGVFVTEKGTRSRPLDVKWSGLPLTFVYREPFLYITYFNCIQATVVPASKQEVKGRQTIIDLQSPRYLGTGVTAGSVFIFACNNNAIELLCLRGLDEQESAADDKENRRVDSLRYADKMQVRFVSPQKDSRRRLSLTSMESNTSESSISS